MKSLSKSIRSLALAAAALLLPAMLASCQWMKEDFDDEIADSSAARYINITVSVSASNEAVTRATPQGGEYGDGWEKGFDRENEVENITLIFFQDENGVNTTNEDTKVLAVKTFDVHKLTDDDLPSTYGHSHKPTEPTNNYYDKEVIYSTGDQLLSDDDVLKPGQKYNVIVVANANPQLSTVSTPAITAGMTVKQARDAKFTAAYQQNSEVATDATKFVMTSECEATVELKNPTVVEDENKFIYYLDCIHIERLSARIDFFAKTKKPGSSDYQKVEYNKYGDAATSYDKDGYVYPVGNSGDFFVLTRIIPFNLMNGNEYMLKRTNNDSKPYLADESNSNWVLDPYSSVAGGKNSIDHHPLYITNGLNDLKAFTDVQFAAHPKTVTLSSRQTPSTTETEGGKFYVNDGVTADNIILSYPKENTLNGDVSPLYYYATGLAFEGYYYKAGQNTGGTRKVFYHYLRHQGEQDVETYQALTNETLSTETKCPASTAMNFGIVRNNIYRVSIESITPDITTEELYVKLLIKVKKWDKFVHTPIYM